MAGKLHSDQVLLQNQRPVLRAETHVDGYPTAIHKKSHNAEAPVNKKVYSESEGLIFVLKLEMVSGSNFSCKSPGPKILVKLRSRGVFPEIHFAASTDIFI